MKLKKLFILAAAAALSLQLASAQSTNTPLNTLVKDIGVKIKAKHEAKQGLPTAAELAPELARFDALIADQKGAKTDDAAQIIYMKAMLYNEVLDDSDKGSALLTQLKDEYADTKYGKSAAKMMEKMAAHKSMDAALATGKAFPDFAEKDLDGKPLSVAALKGKVVLVDFWATWCGPCKAELPNVIEAYKKYHPQGFEIVGVSLDSDRAKLDDFLKKHDGMAWPQYFDGEGWQNKLAQKYAVESIPFAVLVGPDGKIIDKGENLRGEALAVAVGKALGK